MSPRRILRLYIRADLCKGIRAPKIPTPEQELAKLDADNKRLVAKQQSDAAAQAARQQTDRIRADDHARVAADSRFAAKQKADAAHLESLRRALEDDDDEREPFTSS